MRISFARRAPIASLFASTRRDDFLERYVVREHQHGRPLAEILDDPYLRNWSTPEQRARLLERPALVAAIGEHALAELRTAVVRGEAT